MVLVRNFRSQPRTANGGAGKRRFRVRSSSQVVTDPISRVGDGYACTCLGSTWLPLAFVRRRRAASRGICLVRTCKHTLFVSERGAGLLVMRAVSVG